MNNCPYCQIVIDWRQMKEKHCNNCKHAWQMFHVIPVNDLKKHRESHVCSCLPEIKHDCGNMIVIHNSFDGREGVEWAKEILNG